MIGIRVQNPLTIIVTFAVLDLIFVHWLALLEVYISTEVTPFIVGLWLMAAISPEWRCSKDDQ